MAKGARIGVVGGGLGGLAAACVLAARGYLVTLFEKSDWLGGKAAVLEGEGFRFDMGPTILTLPSVLRRIFAEAGRKLEGALTLLPCDPQWRSFFSDGATLDLVPDLDQMMQRLEAFAPGQSFGQGYRDFLSFSRRLNSISERFFFWRSIGSIWDMLELRSLFQPAMLRDVLSMKLGKSVAQCVRAHVPEPRIAQMLDHFTQYVGSSPDHSPAVLCAIAHMQTHEGVWYPLGGTGAVPRALGDLAAELGVEVRLGTGVRRILVEGKRVSGIETDAGEVLPFAAVVSGADAVRTHRELIGGQPAARFEKRRKYEPACSGVVLYLGLDRAYEHIAHHNFVFSRDPHAEFDAIYRQGVPAPDPTCYVCAPARSEPGVAPPGGEALYVLVHAPYLRPGQDWARMLPDYRRTILGKLADTAGMSDLESRIRFERHLTPQDIHDRYHVLDGAIYGLASHGKMFGAFKPANRSPDVQGLYLAGGAAHPGPGMPMVLMSGWIAADTLDRDMAPVGQAARLSKPGTGEPPVLRGAAPRRSPWLVRLFASYARRYVARNFHAVRLARAGRPIVPAGEPLIVVLNHPSWWDPLLGAVLTGLFPGYRHYAPIDDKGLAKYRFLEHLGFFGIEVGTQQGALAFLRTSEAALAQPSSALWITAQGKFTDPRQRPVKLREGVGHLVRRLGGAVVLPLAIEYPFWQERFPEALAHFGEPIRVGSGRERTVAEWMRLIEAGLTSTHDALAAAAQERDPAAFETLIEGNTGVGGVYDLWRRFKALLSGRRFDSAHGPQEAPARLGGVS